MPSNRIFPDNGPVHPLVAFAFEVSNQLEGYDWIVTTRNGQKFEAAPELPQRRNDVLELMGDIFVATVDLVSIEVRDLL